MFNILLLGTRGRDSFILLNPYILSRDLTITLSLISLVQEGIAL